MGEIKVRLPRGCPVRLPVQACGRGRTGEPGRASPRGVGWPRRRPGSLACAPNVPSTVESWSVAVSIRMLAAIPAPSAYDLAGLDARRSPPHFPSMFYRPDQPDAPRAGLLNALVLPRPIGWISTLDREGRANLAPYSFFNAVA